MIMLRLIAWLRSFKPIPVCPECRLLCVEALDTNCPCEWAKQHVRDGLDR